MENSPSCIISAPINILIGFSCCIGKFHCSNSVCFICNSFPSFFYAWSFFMYKHDAQFTKTFGNCLYESNSCKTCIMQKLKAILNFALLMKIFMCKSQTASTTQQTNVKPFFLFTMLLKSVKHKEKQKQREKTNPSHFHSSIRLQLYVYFWKMKLVCPAALFISAFLIFPKFNMI